MKAKTAFVGLAVSALWCIAQAQGPTSDSVRESGTARVVTLPGGATMEMIWCAPGTFDMGSPVGEDGRFENEVPHQVTLTRGFWLGKHEVTQRQWESVMHSNHSRFRNPDSPVENISWHDCATFLKRVNAALGGAARFPTEAEWEYACRAGSDAPVAGSGVLADMAWYEQNSDSVTHEAGAKKPNAWGFHDMQGNVLEWCNDWFSTLSAESAVDPKGPPSGAFKVLKGGCWFFYGRDCRCAYRLRREPSLKNCIFGFRMACSDFPGNDATPPKGK